MSYFYKVLVGKAYHGGKKYDADDPDCCVLEYPTDDLCQKQPNKFELLIDPATIPKKLADPLQEPEVGSDVNVPLGDDVTADYPDAVGADLLVFEKRKGRGRRYFVSNELDPYTALNDVPLTSKGLAGFLEAHGE